MNNPHKDIRILKTYFASIAFSAFIFLTFGSVAFAQQGIPVQIADAITHTEVKSELVTQYRGMPELKAPLASLNYPEDAKKMGIEGRVVLRYTVNEQGRAIDVEVLHGLGYGCDEEAVRILEKAVFNPIEDAQGELESRTFITPFTFRLY